MAIDYRGFAIPKGTARVLDRIERKRDLALQERTCRQAVRLRDHGRCVVPGCKERSQHLHHITYRSRGGRCRSENVCSLCVKHHQMVHAALIEITGNADEELFITGDKQLLKFVV
jgi:hypothetical protein